MKLLILTQKIDKADDTLGFFHNWLAVLAGRFSHITAICLEQGKTDLPKNIHVLSLGKETRSSRLGYVWRFYKYIWSERRNYDTVFIHMNQEYVLLGGIIWKFLGKKVCLWRNHPQGSFLTRIAVLFSDRVFCTSPFSYTARFKKTRLMPVGIDIEKFKPTDQPKIFGSIISLGRLSPIKKPELLIEAAAALRRDQIPFRISFVGNAPDTAYKDVIKQKIAENDIANAIVFEPPVPNDAVPGLMNNYEIYVNMTPTGSMDKAIFEAMACETIAVVSNQTLKGKIPDDIIFKENDSQDFARALRYALGLSDQEKRELGKKLRQYVIDNHSLDALMDCLEKELS